MNVFVICASVDLGSHVHSIYLDEQKADEICKDLNDEYFRNLKEILIKSCDYTNEQAEMSINNRSDKFFVEVHEVVS